MSLDIRKPKNYRKAPVQEPTPWMLEQEKTLCICGHYKDEHCLLSGWCAHIGDDHGYIAHCQCSQFQIESPQEIEQCISCLCDVRDCVCGRIH